MSNIPPDPTAKPNGAVTGSTGVLSEQRANEKPAGDDVLPSWDVPPPVALPVTEPVVGDIPVALPVGPVVRPTQSESAFPLAVPIVGGPLMELPLTTPLDLFGGPKETEPTPEPEPELEAVEPPEPEPAAPAEVIAPPARPTSITCAICDTSNPIEEAYCAGCGYYFSPADIAAATQGSAIAVADVGRIGNPSSPIPPERLQERYELQEIISSRLGVERYRALDHGQGRSGVPVIVVKQVLPVLPTAIPVAADTEPVPAVPENDEIMPTFDEPEAFECSPTNVMQAIAKWPSIGWERKLLRTLEHPALPAELDYFCDDTHEYLVEEVPTGTLLWDAWDDPDAGASRKFGYLAGVADTLHRLHQCNALLEGLRPDIVVIDERGEVRCMDISDLLPLPVPSGAPVRGGLYTAPELLKGERGADARAELYSFGAMLYALHVGRELNEKTDFDGPGNPKPFIPRFPDIHPGFGRLMMKTFRKTVESRFPTDEASKEDATGFVELIRTLEVLRRTYDNVRLEIASWTSTGIVRTGNEDAFAVLHACESRQDDLGEASVVILCDGMGGYEAGEVAAALTIQTLRQNLVQLRPFSAAAGASPFLTDPLAHTSRPEGHAAPPVDVNEVKKAIRSALREANRLVFQTSRAPGSKRRGMGCTAEVVYIDGQNVIVGHVGDSRTYHLHEGRLIQLTRDQTLVNRLVELGSLTAEEAEKHPRRNELQQAIGGQPDVDVGLYHGKLTPGDWVVVCSDGLTNHVTAKDLQHMLLSEAVSAEMAARRLVNLTLIEGATDNVTVVAIRAT